MSPPTVTLLIVMGPDEASSITGPAAECENVVPHTTVGGAADETRPIELLQPASSALHTNMPTII